jgi:hypothetical protein
MLRRFGMISMEAERAFIRLHDHRLEKGRPSPHARQERLASSSSSIRPSQVGRTKKAGPSLLQVEPYRLASGRVPLGGGILGLWAHEGARQRGGHRVSLVRLDCETINLMTRGNTMTDENMAFLERLQKRGAAEIF